MLRLVVPTWSVTRRQFRVLKILESPKMTLVNIQIYEFMFPLLFTTKTLRNNGETNNYELLLGIFMRYPHRLSVFDFVWIESYSGSVKMKVIIANEC